MIPGPDYIYACPQCGSKVYRGSIVSGNTFGAQLYSDGRQIAPMLPEFPVLTQCPECRRLFWLDKMEPVETVHVSDKEKLSGIPEAKFLYIYSYLRALVEGIYDGDDDEKYIRTRIWWCFNDGDRYDIIKFVDEGDEKDYRDNCLRLVELCDVSDDAQRLQVAEIYRNLGQFDQSLKILDGLNPEYNWFADRIREECRKANVKVVLVKGNKG